MFDPYPTTPNPPKQTWLRMQLCTASFCSCRAWNAAFCISSCREPTDDMTGGMVVTSWTLKSHVWVFAINPLWYVCQVQKKCQVLHTSCKIWVMALDLSKIWRDSILSNFLSKVSILLQDMGRDNMLNSQFLSKHQLVGTTFATLSSICSLFASILPPAGLRH